MINLQKILSFKGSWREYQVRVLSDGEEHLKDGRVHIVAAPGSGKTTLGIEFIQRINRPTLILVPSITIRHQWYERIRTAFLTDGSKIEEVVSEDLKQPKFITIATYQALHAAVTRFKGQLSPQNDDSDEDDKETGINIDFSQFDLVRHMLELGLGTICLDECHHLRNAWWKSLELFRKKFSSANLISLTATPPYDSSPTMWRRYFDMCGPIDAEISIPELVKEGSLCPHQDFVYLNFPSREEQKQLDLFHKSRRDMYNQLMSSDDLEEAVLSHQALIGDIDFDKLLDNPTHLSALLVYLQAKGLSYPPILRKTLSEKQLPKMSVAWLEKLLQHLLYDSSKVYTCSKELKEKLRDRLKASGFIEKKVVKLTYAKEEERLLTNSLGKLASIEEIAVHEFRHLQGELRQLILTDYIRKPFLKFLGDEQAQVNQLGVLPFFELLRRTFSRQDLAAGLAVLTGSIVIVPTSSLDRLKELLMDKELSVSQAGQLSLEDYQAVSLKNSQHDLTLAVTQLFNEGYIHVLIGTKSLLGEGWDAPSVNSLILASFVGSYMLSNQMRGRAIRTWSENPKKTANIWHLVTLNPELFPDKETLSLDETISQALPNQGQGENSEDFLAFKRKMQHFLGLHYNGRTIENGHRRLSHIREPYLPKRVAGINKETLALANKREDLYANWKQALAIINEVQIVDEIEIGEKAIPTIVLLPDILKASFFSALFITVAYVFQSLRFGSVSVSLFVFALGVFYLAIQFYRLWPFLSPFSRLQQFGNGIARALEKRGHLSGKNYIVETDFVKLVGLSVYRLSLNGGSQRDKELFTQAVTEFFAPIENQRYLLVKKKQKRLAVDNFFAIPSIFSRREEVDDFVQSVATFIKGYESVYTRNEKGRKILLDARLGALANRQEEQISCKKRIKDEFH